MVPQISSVAHEEDADILEEKGRAIEVKEILAREHIADTIREDEPVPGRKAFTRTVALKAALVSAQVRDAALASTRAKCLELNKSTATTAGRVTLSADEAAKGGEPLVTAPEKGPATEF